MDKNVSINFFFQYSKVWSVISRLVRVSQTHSYPAFLPVIGACKADSSPTLPVIMLEDYDFRVMLLPRAGPS